MYHFLYISPIKTLISAEIINNVTKNNVTRIYNTEYNTVLANYENAIPIKVSSQTKSFINHNSKDLINSIVYFKGIIRKNIFENHKNRDEETRILTKKMYDELEKIEEASNDKEKAYQENKTVSNRFNFDRINADFEFNLISQIKLYQNFLAMTDVEKQEIVRNGYLKALKSRQEIFQLNESLYNEMEDKISNVDIELSFSIQDIKEELEESIEQIKKSHKYFYSRPLRVKSFEMYGLDLPNFKEIERSL